MAFLSHKEYVLPLFAFGNVLCENLWENDRKKEDFDKISLKKCKKVKFSLKVNHFYYNFHYTKHKKNEKCSVKRCSEPPH